MFSFSRYMLCKKIMQWLCSFEIKLQTNTWLYTNVVSTPMCLYDPVLYSCSWYWNTHIFFFKFLMWTIYVFVAKMYCVYIYCDHLWLCCYIPVYLTRNSTFNVNNKYVLFCKSIWVACLDEITKTVVTCMYTLTPYNHFAIWLSFPFCCSICLP